ncbi:hypothetical protein D9M68_961430 [compost metagenome]
MICVEFRASNLLFDVGDMGFDQCLQSLGFVEVSHPQTQHDAVLEHRDFHRRLP